ncbi:hypothetical protein GBAR_LOCUS15295 [Geodia barretti]|uniref:E3 ubiquitin-protein ligase n=1 Tax=Geodia barretti TaxID=519541 RepID=A0AA35WTZ2_GEOBA|nr:hypothetical protein GBAR_LOCUS15295 [Geodia barretti]
MRIPRLASMAAISGGCVNVVVWQRQRRDGGYSPFPPHDSAIIEAAYGAQSSSCNVGGLRVDLKNMLMKQTRRSECKIQRHPTSIPASPPILAYWTWEEGHTNFAVYSIGAILDIEQAYQQRRPIVDLSLCPCMLPYTLDFTTMTQMRHHYQTQRTIKREPLHHGQSLQSLLAPVSVGHPGAPLASGTGMFSLATGPATNILNSMSAAASAAHSMITRSSYSQPATYIQPAPSYTQPGGSGVSTTGQTASGSSKTTGSTAAPGKGRRGKKGVAVSSSPPLGRRGKDDSGVLQVPEYAVIEKTLDKDDDGSCPICMCQLSEKSGYDDEGGGGGGGVEMRPIPYAPPVDLCKLRNCGHMMHRPCLLMMLKSESTKVRWGESERTRRWLAFCSLHRVHALSLHS